MDHPAEVCLNCGATFSGRYCSSCGERAVHEGDMAVGHLFHDFVHEFTHVDGRIWGSFVALLVKPGQLTKDYWEGRRGKWLRPLRIFLIVTALSLLLAPEAAGPLGMRVWAIEGPRGMELTVGTRPEQAKARPGAAAVDPEKLKQITGKIQTVYKVIQYVGLALFAAASLLVGRRVQPYYGAHLIFALHYYSFEYVLSGLVNRLHVSPVVPIGVGFLYLMVALWRLTGLGWGSFWRASFLTAVVGVIELGLMAAAASIAVR